MINLVLAMLVAVCWTLAAWGISQTYGVPAHITASLAACGSFVTAMLAVIADKEG